MKILQISLFCFCSFITSAQNQDSNWLLGITNTYTNIISFENLEPSLTVNEENFNNSLHATNTSYSDEAGNLLFYTNGIKIFNSLHQIMENGDSLNCCEFIFNDLYDSGYAAQQGAYIFRSQLLENIYYMIHTEAVSEFGGSFKRIFYSKIDMNANGGLGKVVEKNIEIFNGPLIEKVSVTRHANGRDWWIVFPEKFENKYYRFLFSQDNFIGPFEQVLDSEIHNNWSIGTSSFSPNGNNYVHTTHSDEIVILDFNRCTGEFSNELQFKPFNLNQSSNVYRHYGLAFSPNNQFLYLNYLYFNDFPPTHPDSVYYGIIQFDLNTQNIKESRLEVYRTKNGLGLFFGNGLDGRIYFTYSETSLGDHFLSTINQPNKRGIDTDVREDFLSFPMSSNNGSILPRFPNYRLGPIDNSPCDTLGIDNLPLAGFRCEPDSSNNLQIIFTDNSFYEPTEWSWSFGDGEMSADTSPVHTFAELDIYEVCLTVSNDNASDTYCKILDLNPVSVEEIVLEEGAFLVFPNPARNKITVKLNNKVIQGDKIHIYNNVGILVKSISLVAEQIMLNIDIEQLPKGIYFVNYHSDVNSNKYTKISILK